MKAPYVACAIAALLLGAAIPLKSHAEDEPKMTAAQIADGQSKADVANALIVLGRADKDPDMLMTAAKLLAAIGAPVADPKASAEGKPVFYDVDAIVVEADGYAANRSTAKPMSPSPKASFCRERWLLPLRILVRQPELQLCLGLLR